MKTLIRNGLLIDPANRTEAKLNLVLENGKVVGDGDHTSLMRDCPLYREIAESQLSEGSE